MKLRKTQLFYLVNKSTEAFCHTRLVRDEKLEEVPVSSFFRADNYTDVMENLHSVRHFMSLSNKHNYKSLTKGPTASLLLCIKNILNQSVKCLDSLTMAALSFTK